MRPIAVRGRAADAVDGATAAITSPHRVERASSSNGVVCPSRLISPAMAAKKKSKKRVSKKKAAKVTKKAAKKKAKKKATRKVGKKATKKAGKKAAKKAGKKAGKKKAAKKAPKKAAKKAAPKPAKPAKPAKRAARKAPAAKPAPEPVPPPMSYDNDDSDMGDSGPGSDEGSDEGSDDGNDDGNDDGDLGEPPKPAARRAPSISPLGASSVDEYVLQLEAWQQEVVEALRTLVRQTVANVRESMRWAVPVFDAGGPFCHIKPFARYVHFGFWRGAEMADPEGVLTTDRGGKMRYVRIERASDVAPATLAALIDEAVALNKAANGSAAPEAAPPRETR
jgi:hypothetical protein